MRPDVPLPERANQTTPERPWPVRLLSTKIAEYVARMSPLWVEGQIVQLNRRPGAGMAFLTLRDTDVDMSLAVKIFARDLPDVAEGARVVVHAKPDFYLKNGSLSLHAREIRAVGLGELLARIEQLKQVLAAEGLFAAERKIPLPFLPRVVGLICGRESKAEHDVVVNARARWPGVRFEIREVAVQGVGTVAQVSRAIAELDALPEVDVIVIARGGGSVEDLLPFSNEQLVRAAAASRTPIVSAIGHETDTPLLDLVADYRASTPTAAAKRVVPDVAEERRTLLVARQRLRASITGRLRAERALLDSLRSRPVLADPTTMVTTRERDVAALLDTLRQTTTAHLERHTLAVDSLRRHLRALSPLATLERGYAVLRTADGHVVRDAAEVTAGRLLDARVARGRLAVEVRSAHPEATPGSATLEP
ncbi:exodeoxyribonuclease VII large subunit [uncultured Georgenia sp.]|uniref:exodeoxyribonuclease VII large subunit n=1 Tax=uncultured Georgenia sp. TaxID=378209 RepID=UPI0026078D6C|nr:exodeoxyribonuclease VII large subunit [uncultured Georgenia sp.]HLV04259.1 exodeoxyribonuclease VII large subunit [Actinomycetaceae bacterium]